MNANMETMMSATMRSWSISTRYACIFYTESRSIYSTIHESESEAPHPSMEQLRTHAPSRNRRYQAGCHSANMLHLVFAFVAPGHSWRYISRVVSCVPEHMELRDDGEKHPSIYHVVMIVDCGYQHQIALGRLLKFLRDGRWEDIESLVLFQHLLKADRRFQQQRNLLMNVRCRVHVMAPYLSKRAHQVPHLDGLPTKLRLLGMWSTHVADHAELQHTIADFMVNLVVGVPFVDPAPQRVDVRGRVVAPHDFKHEYVQDACEHHLVCP